MSANTEESKTKDPESELEDLREKLKLYEDAAKRFPTVLEERDDAIKARNRYRAAYYRALAGLEAVSDHDGYWGKHCNQFVRDAMEEARLLAQPTLWEVSDG